MMERYPIGIKFPEAPETTPPKRLPPEDSAAMLRPTSAWRSLCARTGGFIARPTFYRWVRTGKVYSIRLGSRIFIPQAALDDLVKECLTGEGF